MSKKKYGSSKPVTQKPETKAPDETREKEGAKKADDTSDEIDKKEVAKDAAEEKSDAKVDSKKEQTSSDDKTDTKVEEKVDSENDAETSTDEIAKPVKGIKGLTIAGVALLFISVIVLAVLVVGVYVFDIGNGEDTPEKAALHYAKAVTSVSEDDIYSIIPRQLRKEGLGSAQEDLNYAASFREKRNATVSDIRVTQTVDWSDKVAALKKGIVNTYGKELDITDAKYIDLSAIMSYNRKSDSTEATDSDVKETSEAKPETKEVEISFGVTVIKVGNKWYVYTVDTAKAAEAMSEEETTAKTEEPKTTEDATATEAKEVEKPKDIEVKALDLDFYEGALEDLQAGKLRVESKDYVMPIVYDDFKNVVTIEEDIIDEESRTIEPNKLLIDVPCNYVNEEYAKAGLNICLGNATANECDLLDGIVTTYYFSYPGTAFEYPMVYLPGNVTIKTSYDDIVKMYGELEKYDKEDIDAKSYCKNLHIISDDVYFLKLNNVHNYIYFGFDADKKLTEVQYYYHDLNGFEDLTEKEETEE